VRRWTRSEREGETTSEGSQSRTGDRDDECCCSAKWYIQHRFILASCPTARGLERFVDREQELSLRAEDNERGLAASARSRETARAEASGRGRSSLDEEGERARERAHQVVEDRSPTLLLGVGAAVRVVVLALLLLRKWRECE